MTYQEVVKKLEKMAKPENVRGMKRFGMAGKGRLGILIPGLRNLAKAVGKNHVLALQLWEAPYQEAKILAGLIAEADKLTEKQVEQWVLGFESWDVCDQVCMNLFDKTAFAFQKASQWAKRKEEFVKRAGFALMASLAVHNKKAQDSDFAKFFPLIQRAATDERNFVKKAVNWALRQIGKRNLVLNAAAVEVAKEIAKQASPSARWIAKDALRELASLTVQKKIKSKS